MKSDKYICTHCGYEGKPIRRPSDDATGVQSDSSKAIARIANLIFPGLGMLIRPLALFLMIPVYIVLWAIKRAVNGPKFCQNCGLPLMVRKTSDAGEIAMRKQALKEGVRFEKPEPPKVAFGKEIALPGDEDKNAKPAPAPQLDKLPSLEVLLQDAPAPAAPEPEAEVPQQPKKQVDPDQW